MPKVKDGKRQRNLARISSQGNLTCGVGPSSRVFEDFVLLPDWTTEDGDTISTPKVCLRYRFLAEQYCNSLPAAQEFLACSVTTAGDADTGSGFSMAESGLEYFPTPRKGRQLEAIFKDIWAAICLVLVSNYFSPH